MKTKSEGKSRGTFALLDNENGHDAGGDLAHEIDVAITRGVGCAVDKDSRGGGNERRAMHARRFPSRATR